MTEAPDLAGAPATDARPPAGSDSAASPGVASASSEPAGPSGRQVWRAARGPVLVGLGLLLIAVISVLARPTSPIGKLDPAAANDSGSRALAQLLGQRGVSIERTTTVVATRRAVDPGELLVVTRPELLSQGATRALAKLPGDRLLIAPGAATVRALAPEVSVAGHARAGVRGPACGLREATRAGNAATGGQLFRVNRTSRAGSRVWRCYPAGGHPSLVRVASGARTVTVVGAGRAFTNQHLDERGNAALAMNLVGDASSVVWLSPDPAAMATGGRGNGDGGGPGGPGSPGGPGGSGGTSAFALLPEPVLPAAAQVGVAVALLALWRMRRLGPVVAERLPVRVRAAETLEGRARLYRSRRARNRAAQALRKGSLRRVAPRAGVAADGEPHAVAEAVSARTGWTASDVGDVLYGSVPGDDAALVRLADDLSALETEVRRT